MEARSIFIERRLLSILRNICQQEDIVLSELSRGWVLRLTYQGKVRHIFANTFDCDTAATQKIVADKVATSAILEYATVPHVEHELFYGFQRAKLTDSIWQPIMDYARRHDGKVVVKALNSSGGKDVYICFEPKELEFACYTLFQSQAAVSLSPYYHAQHEYRLMMFQGQCEILYRKNKPHIVGDGRHSIAQLINYKARKQADGQQAHLLRSLIPKNSDDILAKGELLVLSNKHNLSKGAAVSMVEEGVLRDELLDLAQRTVNALGLRFGSVDILATETGLRVLEVNSGVMVDNFLKMHPELTPTVEGMYRKVVRSLFET